VLQSMAAGGIAARLRGGDDGDTSHLRGKGPCGGCTTRLVIRETFVKERAGEGGGGGEVGFWGCRPSGSPRFFIAWHCAAAYETARAVDARRRKKSRRLRARLSRALARPCARPFLNSVLSRTAKRFLLPLALQRRWRRNVAGEGGGARRPGGGCQCVNGEES
jgi:hypothetical protein